MLHTLRSTDQGLHYCFYVMKKGSRRPEDQPHQLLSYDPEAHAVNGGMNHAFMDQEDFLSFIEVDQL